MQYFSAYLALIAATSVLALPLNINLGAYSPALVVGDGEISFGGEGGEKNAAALINTLSGASAGTAGAAEGLQRAGEATPTADIVSPAVVPISEPEAKKRDDSPVEKRDLAGFNAALAFATGALKTSPGVELGTGEGGSGVGIIVKPGVNSGAAEPARVGKA